MTLEQKIKTRRCAYCGHDYSAGQPGSASYGDNYQVKHFCATCLDEIAALSDFSDLVDRAGVTRRKH